MKTSWGLFQDLVVGKKKVGKESGRQCAGPGFYPAEGEARSKIGAKPSKSRKGGVSSKEVLQGMPKSIKNPRGGLPSLSLLQGKHLTS